MCHLAAHRRHAIGVTEARQPPRSWLSRRGRAGSGINRHFKRPLPPPCRPLPAPSRSPSALALSGGRLDSSHRPPVLRAEDARRPQAGAEGNPHAPHENVTDVRKVAALTGFTAVQSFALPSHETDITYYSDATLTEGWAHMRGCSESIVSTDGGLRMSLRLHRVKGTGWVRSMTPSRVTGHGASG